MLVCSGRTFAICLRTLSFISTRSVCQWRLSKTIPLAPVAKKAAAALGSGYAAPDDHVHLTAALPEQFFGAGIEDADGVVADKACGLVAFEGHSPDGARVVKEAVQEV